jgi:hypothetical protein
MTFFGPGGFTCKRGAGMRMPMTDDEKLLLAVGAALVLMLCGMAALVTWLS